MTQQQMITKHQLIENLLTELQQKLEQHEYWQEFPPLDDYLDSDEPFSIDILSSTEWLQWIFIPKMAYLAKQKLPLPIALSITPYIHHTLLHKNGYSDIVATCKKIDALFIQSFR